MSKKYDGKWIKARIVQDGWNGLEKGTLVGVRKISRNEYAILAYGDKLDANHGFYVCSMYDFTAKFFLKTERDKDNNVIYYDEKDTKYINNHFIGSNTELERYLDTDYAYWCECICKKDFFFDSFRVSFDIYRGDICYVRFVNGMASIYKKVSNFRVGTEAVKIDLEEFKEHFRLSRDSQGGRIVPTNQKELDRWSIYRGEEEDWFEMMRRG